MNTITAYPSDITVAEAKAIDVYTMHVLANGLRLYAKTGIRPNRAYTPTALLQAAERWTGQKFKRGQYLQAAVALEAKADETAAKFVEMRHEKG